jgi:hypothetical protein
VTVYVGGLRQRLIQDSLWNMITNSLDALGWLDPGRPHEPLHLRPKPVPLDEEIQLNTLALSDENITERDEELGSLLAEHRQTFYVDFFAENESIGKHLINDIRAIIGGRFGSVGRTRPAFSVYDYTQATPTALFDCELEDIVVDRARDFPKPWQRFWYVCRFDVVDHYGDEEG